MIPARPPGGGAWMGGNSPVRLSSSIPGLEDDPEWRPAASCSSPTAKEQSLVKGGLAPSSTFSKGILDEEWYTPPGNALMDEMKELSYVSASALASQQAAAAAANISPAHFNLDRPHMPSFSSHNVSSTPFTTLDHHRSHLSSFLDGGRGLDFDTGGSNLTGNVGGSSLLENHNGTSHKNSLGSLLPDLEQIVHDNAVRNRKPTWLPLNNLSPKGPSGYGDGAGYNNHNNQTFGGDLSSIVSPGGVHLGGENGPILPDVERASFRSRNRSSPLEGPAAGSSTGSQLPQPTLFQKRIASLQSISSGGAAAPPKVKSLPHVVTSASKECSDEMADEESANIKRRTHSSTHLPLSSPLEESRRALQCVGSDDMDEFGMDGEQLLDQDDLKEDDDMDDSGDGSRAVYETDDTVGMEGGVTGGGQELVPGGGGVGGGKGKEKKGMPAKNLLAERRRRKKLNDRLYMLRSVVPKITKMDRASILGDAIEYLKDLLEQINDLHAELEGTPAEGPQSPSPPALPAPNTVNLPFRVKEEPMSSAPSPNPQPARVEVRALKGKALNIHMLCQGRPGLLLSTMRALDGLGLDVQQAVVSCFNGFALDVFKAEQSKDTDVGPEEIRAVLLHAAGTDGA